MHHVLCRVFGETPNHMVTQPLYSRDLAPCNSWLFPNLKSPLNGRHIRLSMRFRRMRWGHWWQLVELCEVPRCLHWRGLRHHCPMYKVSCSWIFFNKCLYFSYNMAGYLLDRPHMLYSSLSPTCPWLGVAGWCQHLTSSASLLLILLPALCSSNTPVLSWLLGCLGASLLPTWSFSVNYAFFLWCFQPFLHFHLSLYLSLHAKSFSLLRWFRGYFHLFHAVSHFSLLCKGLYIILL